MLELQGVSIYSARPLTGEPAAGRRPALRFMGSKHLQKMDANRGHEPNVGAPASGTARSFIGNTPGRRPALRFMERLHDTRIPHRGHEPETAAECGLRSGVFVVMHR